MIDKSLQLECWPFELFPHTGDAARPVVIISDVSGNCVLHSCQLLDVQQLVGPHIAGHIPYVFTQLVSSLASLPRDPLIIIQYLQDVRADIVSICIPRLGHF